MSEVKESEEVVSKPETKREETMETQADTESNVSDTAGTTSSGTGAANPMSLLSDEELVARAKEHLKKDQVLVASRLLENVTNIADEDEPFRKEVEEKAALLNRVIADLLSEPKEQEESPDVAAAAAAASGGEQGANDGWIKGGEYHDQHRDTIMYYRLEEDLQLKCRLESPVESSLLVPLLSVLIETEHYMSWFPSWTVPRIGVASADKLGQMGRTEQVIHFTSAVPWPFRGRDVVIRTCAADDIDDIEDDPNTTGSIAISLVSIKEGQNVHKSKYCNPLYENEKDVVEVPPIPEGMERADFEGGMLFRKCPPDHATLRNSTVQYPPDEHLVLVGFSLHLDGKISPMFPAAVINFVIQVAVVQMWAMFLKVAEEIREGSRPQHAAAIAAKREEIYDWVDQRIEGMFDHFEKKKSEKDDATSAGDEKKVE